MTREFNKNQRYDARPPYRGSSPNNRNGAEQPSRPTRPRLNRAMVDRAWEDGAPHRHADYKPRHSNEAGTAQTNYGPNTQRNWRKTQPSEHSSYDHAPHERDEHKRHARYNDSHSQSHRSDYSPNEHPGSRSRSTKPNNSFADRPPYHDQHKHGNGENTYRAHNGPPNFSHRPQETNRGRNNQEASQQESQRNAAYPNRTNPTNRMGNAGDRRDQRPRPHDRRESPYQANRFEGQQQSNGNEPRNSLSHATPGKQRENRNQWQAEQFEGDYEQFNHAPSRQQRDGRWQEKRQPQTHSKRTGKPPEGERHVTALPDGHVLKGPRPAQRKNAQFWTDISQDTEKLVSHVQTPVATTETSADKEAQTSTLPVQQSSSVTRVISPRAKAAKRAASAARKGKTQRPISNGPRPSKRGFKWPSVPSQS